MLAFQTSVLDVTYQRHLAASINTRTVAPSAMCRHELSDEEWAIIAPLLPNNSRGIARVDDRRVINGILWRFRTGSSWRDVPERYGPRTTLYNRFSRWRKAGVWDRLLDAVSKRYDGDIVMIDSSCVRVHQHGANAKKGALPILAWPQMEKRPPDLRRWPLVLV